MDAFKTRLDQDAEFVTRALDTLLPVDNGPDSRLMEAVRYAALLGGKRVRPYLTLRPAALFNVDPKCALPAAAAIDMVPCHALVLRDPPDVGQHHLLRRAPN